jgi:hypothetical protein
MNRLPICARVGVLHGVIVGFLFSLWRMATGFAGLAAHEFVWGVLLLSALALLCSLFVLVVVVRYLAVSVFWPAAVNAILVALLTALVINVMPPHRFFLLLGVWIGTAVGLLVGLVLCRLCLDRLVATAVRGGGDHGR